jgi:hypothetical protein
VKAFALTIPYIGLKIRTKTSTIIKANMFAMHGPSAKIADSKVNKCISHDQSLI